MMEFILGIFFGYMFGVFIGGKKEGQPGRLHFQQFIDKTGLHLHHWLIFLIILIIYIVVHDNRYNIIEGFLVGGIIHGLTYNDWYKIIV
jgi:hypothetical protein